MDLTWWCDGVEDNKTKRVRERFKKHELALSYSFVT